MNVRDAFDESAPLPQSAVDALGYIDQLQAARDDWELTARVESDWAEEARAERDRWIRLFNRLEGAVAHHKRKIQDTEIGGTSVFVDETDEALWAATDRILRDAAEGVG